MRPTISWRAALAVGLAAGLLSACATVPDSGPVTSGKIAAVGSQGQEYLQPIPLPPKAGWDPREIVYGFLAANASSANNYQVAREYLTPLVQDKWNPGLQVRVVTRLSVGKAQAFAHNSAPGPYEPTEVEVVTATGDQVAALTKSGQYVRTQEKAPAPITFQLTKVDNQWRISDLPPELVLTQPDFQRVYMPQDLYFLANADRTLVPDPVFVPLNASSVNLVGQLVHALLSNPQGWLAGAAQTALPGAHLLRSVTIDGGTAVIDLGGRGVATASSAQLNEMAAQLNWTLANPADGQSPVQSVQLETNGRLRRAVGWSGDEPSQPRPALPVPPANAVLYSTGASGAVQARTGPSSLWRNVPGEAGQGHVPLTTIAVSPDERYVAGIAETGKTGDAVYYAGLQRDGKFAHWSHAGGFTSLSWDVHDNLWAAGPQGVWMIPPGGGSPVQVALGLPSGYHVTQFRVALDGVRVAMIVENADGSSGAQLRVGAIVRSGGGVSIGQTGQMEPVGADVSNPIQLTWYNADNLLVLSNPSGGSQLQEVPINGGAAQSLIVEPDTLSISAAGSGNNLAAGLSNGRMTLTPGPNGTWVPGGRVGAFPTYPG